MNKNIFLTAVIAVIAIEFLFPEIAYASTSGDVKQFADMTTKFDSIKAFATQTILPFGGVLGAVYGAFKSYMSSSPWPMIMFGTTAVAATLGPSLIQTATWTALLK